MGRTLSIAAVLETDDVTTRDDINVFGRLVLSQCPEAEVNWRDDRFELAALVDDSHYDGTGIEAFQRAIYRGASGWLAVREVDGMSDELELIWCAERASVGEPASDSVQQTMLSPVLRAALERLGIAELELCRQCGNHVDVGQMFNLPDGWWCEPCFRSR